MLRNQLSLLCSIHLEEKIGAREQQLGIVAVCFVRCGSSLGCRQQHRPPRDGADVAGVICELVSFFQKLLDVRQVPSSVMARRHCGIVVLNSAHLRGRGVAASAMRKHIRPRMLVSKS